jgi:hypothetical protein
MTLSEPDALQLMGMVLALVEKLGGETTLNASEVLRGMEAVEEGRLEYERTGWVGEMKITVKKKEVEKV